jgi:hypothetical protein
MRACEDIDISIIAEDIVMQKQKNKKIHNSFNRKYLVRSQILHQQPDRREEKKMDKTGRNSEKRIMK